MVVDNLVLNGAGSVQFAGTRLLLSHPESGVLVTAYTPVGYPTRTFGRLRPTGFEADRELHLAHNAGVPLTDPTGGFYFVFLTGRPLFRKYDGGGTLVFERHIEGVEMDSLLDTQPTVWPRRRVDDREVPFVTPVDPRRRGEPARRAVDLDGGALHLRVRPPGRQDSHRAVLRRRADEPDEPVHPRRHGARHARLLRVPERADDRPDAPRRHAHKTFGPRVAVERVSFELAPGEIFALLGPNGAGKTTTLRMLAGLITPSSGEVRIRGEPMPRRNGALRASIGFLTEAPGLWDRLTVRQNLHVYARLHGLPQPERPWTRRSSSSTSATAPRSPRRSSRRA